MEISVGCVCYWHFPSEGLKEPSKHRNEASRATCESPLSDFIDSFLPLSLFVFSSLTGQAFFPPVHTTVLLTTCPVSVTFAASRFCIIIFLFSLPIFIDSTGWVKLRSIVESISRPGSFLQGLCATDRVFPDVLTLIGVEY